MTEMMYYKKVSKTLRNIVREVKEKQETGKSIFLNTVFVINTALYDLISIRYLLGFFERGFNGAPKLHSFPQ